MGAGPSTGPEEEAEGAGWSCWGRGQACAAGTLEGPKEQQENRMEGGEINSNVQKGLCVLSFPLKTSSNWSAAPSPSIYNLILQNGCILYISAIIKQSTIKMQHLEINPMFAHYHRTSRILSLSLLRSTQLLTFLPMNLINVYFQRSWHLSSQMCYSLLPFWHNHKPQLLPQKKKKLNVYCNKNQPSLTNRKMWKCLRNHITTKEILQSDSTG